MLPSIKRNEPNWVANWFNEFFGDDCPLCAASSGSSPGEHPDDYNGYSCYLPHECYY